LNMWGVHITPPLTRTHLGFGVIWKQEWHVFEWWRPWLGGAAMTVALSTATADAADGSVNDGGDAWRGPILWLFGALGMLLAAVETIIMAAGVAVWFVGGW